MSDTRHINIFIILVTATSHQKSYRYQKKQSFHYRNFLIISLVRILVSNHTVHPPKTIDRFCVVTVTPRILNDPATRFPAVFRPESYFLNLPRRRNTVRNASPSSNAGKYRKKTAKIFMAGGFISSKERETLTLLSKDTEYASDLQTCEWKSAQNSRRNGCFGGKRIATVRLFFRKPF